jgi:uncharacterized protein involved in exopolysaccharide biosynthesis/Mrp family chromosome partitioning ATPase
MVAAVSPIREEDQEFQLPAPAEEAQPNPIASLARAMRGRWKAVLSSATLLCPALAVAGYFSGVQLYESKAILRVYPQESNILYATGNDSVLKTFDSFVKAETTYVASNPVMVRSVEELTAVRPDLTDGLTALHLSGSIEIKRSDSLIVLRTLSRDRAFASQKLDAVIASYLALKSEAEDARTRVRLSELRSREAELQTRLNALRTDQLEVGGEFGLNALAKAHIEKIAQIDALASRKSEVSATLAALQEASGASSADTSDQEIMRATLLDRAMADLNFERAKLMSELAGLRSEYSEYTNVRFETKEQAKLEEIAVIEQAMADRREQIRVLGQTGALTDATESGNDNTLAEIQSLYDKVSGQLATARAEARDLNRRRIDLDRIENEIEEAEDLLEETRQALEVIRLESGRALPGYAVVMSPPSQPLRPAEDSRKMLMAGGFFGGGILAFALAFLSALRNKRVRFAETLVAVNDKLPVQQVSDAGDSDAHAADSLRNELQLHSLRKPRLVGKAPVIAVTRAVEGDTTDFARSLAESFARSRMKTLFIDADIGKTPGEEQDLGWRELLAGDTAHAKLSDETEGLWELTAGTEGLLDDRMVSANMIRSSIATASQSFDVVIMSTGSLQDRLSAQLILSNSDVGVLVVTPSDARSSVLGQVERLDTLPRNGSIAVMRNALRGDPWLAVRT